MKFKVVALTETDGRTQVVLETEGKMADVHNHLMMPNEEFEATGDRGALSVIMWRIQYGEAPQPHPSGRVVNTVASLTGRGR